MFSALFGSTLSTDQAPALSGAPAIRCVNLSRHYPGQPVLDGFNLEVAPGTFMALLGVSGSGKTTFLRLVAGFDEPDAGLIEIAGRRVVGGGTFVPPEHRRVGMVFQSYALFPHLTVAGNVAYGLRGAPGADVRMREVLALTGLSDLASRMPHELSGGQQQRVALARALAPCPDIVLLDEPFSNLDAGLRVRLRLEVRDILRESGTTAVLVTHDQEEALSLADQVAVIRDGRVAQCAPPEALYNYPSSRAIAEFVGEANFMRGEARGNQVICALGQLTLPLCRPARGDVDVLLRPEWIVLAPDRSSTVSVEKRVFFGHDQMVVIRTAEGERLQVRVGPTDNFQPGERVSMRVTQPVIAYARA